MLRVILLGPPGAGKGTQAKIIAERVGIAHVASGDLFRKHLSKGTELGRLAESYMDKGELVPDEVTINMVLERLGEPDAREGCVLDGFPRTLEQAKALDAALAKRGEAIDRVPSMEVDTEEIVRRLSGRLICRKCQTPFHRDAAPPKQPGVCDVCGGELYQRDDDKPEVVRNRLETYARQTAPLIDYYSKQGKLVRVNGQQDVADVTADLMKAIHG